MNELHLDLDLSDFDVPTQAIGLEPGNVMGIKFLAVVFPDFQSITLRHHHEIMMQLERDKTSRIVILPSIASEFDALIDAALPLFALKNIPRIPVPNLDFPFDMSSIKASYRYKNFVDLEARNTQWKNNALRHQNAGKSKMGRY